MTRRLAAIFAGLLAAAPSARAQVHLSFGENGDTAVGLRPGVATTIRAAVHANGFRINRMRVRYVYDPAKIEIEGVVAQCCSQLYQSVDTVRAPGVFSVGAGLGAGSWLFEFATIPMYRLKVRLQPGVTDGAYIHAEVDTLLHSSVAGNFMAQSRSQPGAMCHASAMYGDVDVDDDIDSRDALITLSAAVGLTVTGFSLGNGDVDQDNLVNSRDALYMLTHSIGQFTGTRISQGIPDACEALATLSDRIVFVRHGASSGPDSLYTMAAGGSAPVYIPNSADQNNYVRYPRLAGNGTTTLYECRSFYGYQHLCRIEVDGTGKTDISPDSFNYFERGDWIKGDTLIAFVFGGFQMNLMSATGTNSVSLGNSFGPRANLAFNRDGTRIAYTETSTYNVRGINPDGTGDGPITAGISDAYWVRWNAGNDTLALSRTNTWGLWRVAAAGGPVSRITGLDAETFDAFDWNSQGLLFSMDIPGLTGLWLLPNNGGPVRRVTRGRDTGPSFRRTP